MSNDRLKIQHYHTTGTTAPNPNNMELGEIAVGTNPNKACLYFKDKNNKLHTVAVDNYLDKNSDDVQVVNGKVKFNKAVETSFITSEEYRSPLEIAGYNNDNIIVIGD